MFDFQKIYYTQIQKKKCNKIQIGKTNIFIAFLFIISFYFNFAFIDFNLLHGLLGFDLFFRLCFFFSLLPLLVIQFQFCIQIHELCYCYSTFPFQRRQKHNNILRFYRKKTFTEKFKWWYYNFHLSKITAGIYLWKMLIILSF